MTSKNKLLHLVHSLNNRLLVIGKLLDVYAKNLPDNKLTIIGNQAYQDSLKELKEISELILNAATTNYSLQEWKEKFVMYIPVLSEMCPFRIKYHFTSLTEAAVAVHPLIIIENLGPYFEELAMTMATEVEITLTATHDFLKLSLVDNSDGSLDLANPALENMKIIWNAFGININLRSIKGIGTSLEISLPLTSKSYNP